MPSSTASNKYTWLDHTVHFFTNDPYDLAQLVSPVLLKREMIWCCVNDVCVEVKEVNPKLNLK